MKRIIKFLNNVGDRLAGIGKGLGSLFNKVKDKIFRKQAEAKKQERFKRGLLIGIGVVLVVVVIGVAIWFTFSRVGQKKETQIQISNPIAEAEVYVVTSRQCGQKCWDTQLFLDALTQRNIKVVKVKKAYVGLWPFSLGNSMAKKYNITKVPTVVVEFQGKNKPDITSFFNSSLGVVTDGKFVLGKILAPYYDLASKKIRGSVNIVYLNDKTCTDCYDVKKHEVALKNLGVDTSNSQVIDIASQEGKDLIAKYGIVKVPTVLISGETSEYQVLAQAWTDVGTVTSDGTYIFTNVDLMEGSYKDLKTGQVVKADANKAIQAVATSTATKK